MSKINRHPVRRTAAGVLASALVLSGAVAAAVPAQAATGFALERIQGNDRYETSAAIAAEFGQATNVIIASGESGRTPDALAANFLAGVQGAPILLTRRDTTPEPILARLRALRTGGATTITVVGGTAAVADAQITSLRALGFTVNRVAGDNRYETAAAIAAAGEGASASNVGILASGVSTIDALAGGPLAYKGKHPVFLTTRDDIPGATVAGMRAAGVTSVYVLGGTAVVSPAVIAELTAAGVTLVGRLAGDDRSATSVAIANELIAKHSFLATTFNLASGTNEGIDALGGAALSGKQNRVLLITNTATSAAPVTGFATARNATLTTAGLIFGGTSVVAPALETAVETAGGATTPPPAGDNTDLTVTPETDVSLTLADEDGDDAASDDRVYTVTGLDNALEYRVTLVAADNVSTSATGNVTFEEDGTTGLAAAGDLDSEITSVNGVPTGFATGDVQSAGSISPSGGTITFRVDGGADESVTPVVYVDGGDNTRLELDDDGAPTEDFGVGGTINFQPEEAGQGAIDPAPVTEVDETEDQIVAGALYNYDSNDRFYIDSDGDDAVEAGEQVTLAEFEAELSEGDTLAGGTYQTNTDFVSEFVLEDLEPGVVTVAVGDTSDDAVELTIPSDDINDGATVQVAYIENDGSPAAPTDANLDDFTVETFTADADTTAAGFQVTIDGLDAETAYDFYVRQVVGGEEGEFSAVETGTTLAAGENDPLESLDAALTDDNSVQGELDATDEFQVGFNRPVAVDTGDLIRLVDAAGESVDLVEGTDFDAAVNTVSETFGGQVYEAGELLTGTVTSALPTIVDRDGNATNNNGNLDFPLTIATQAGIESVTGDFTWTPANDTDRTLEVGTASVDNIRPFITGATLGTDAGTANVFSEATDTLVVTFNEAVAFNGVSAAAVTEAELEAILGTSVAYASGSVVTVANTSANVLTFTISGVTLAEGVATTDVVDGTANANVEDLEENDQRANPTANPVVTP